MTKQDMIIERLDKIIELLEGKKNEEPLISFKSANNKSRDDEIKARELEIFTMLDNAK